MSNVNELDQKIRGIVEIAKRLEENPLYQEYLKIRQIFEAGQIVERHLQKSAKLINQINVQKKQLLEEERRRSLGQGGQGEEGFDDLLMKPDSMGGFDGGSQQGYNPQNPQQSQYSNQRQQRPQQRPGGVPVKKTPEMEAAEKYQYNKQEMGLEEGLPDIEGLPEIDDDSGDDFTKQG